VAVVVLVVGTLNKESMMMLLGGVRVIKGLPFAKKVDSATLAVVVPSFGITVVVDCA
jgi:hypothetical protein